MAQLSLINLASEGITYQVDFGYRESASPDEANFGCESAASTTRRFLVNPWEKRHIFIRWLLGEVATNTDTTPATITRTPPQRHPLYLSLWAMKVLSIKGHRQAPTKPAAGAGTNTYALTEYSQAGVSAPVNHKLARYEKAIIEVEYQFLKYRPMGDGEYAALTLTEEYQRYTELLDPKSSTEYLTLPGMTLKYTRPPSEEDPPEPLERPHGTAIPYGVGRVLPLEEFTMVWHRVPYDVYQDGQFEGAERTKLHERIHGDPYAETPIKPYLGTVNAFPIFGYPAETLLFSGFNPVRRYGPIPTSWEWDLHFTFTFDPNRWNWKYYFDNTQGSGIGASGWYYTSTSGVYPDTEVDLVYGDYLDTPDDDALYNTRNHAFLFKPGAVE